MMTAPDWAEDRCVRPFFWPGIVMKFTRKGERSANHLTYEVRMDNA